MAGNSNWRAVIIGMAGLALLAGGPGKPSAAEDRIGPGWEVQPAPVKEQLRGICSVSRQVAWASGTKGCWLQTTDGGQTWQAGTVPGAGNLDFRDIEAFDARTAVVLSAGSPAKIYRTEDGGGSWREVYCDRRPAIFFDGMAFRDAKYGVAYGDPVDGRFVLIETRDGGRTWREWPRSRQPEAREGEAAFAASGTGICFRNGKEVWFGTGGNAARVLHTGDEGRSWREAAAPVRQGIPSAGVFSLCFLDAIHGVMTGGDYRDEGNPVQNAAWTVDGGATWQPVTGRPPAGFRECVQAVPHSRPMLLVAVGPSGSDYSVDGGRNWIPLPGPAGFHSLDFAPDGTGRAAGRDGLLACFRPGRRN